MTVGNGVCGNVTGIEIEIFELGINLKQLRVSRKIHLMVCPSVDVPKGIMIEKCPLVLICWRVCNTLKFLKMSFGCMPPLSWISSKQDNSLRVRSPIWFPRQREKTLGSGSMVSLT